ncbi:phosphopantetheine-binding protein, partial [Pseudomonas brassicacearum]|uniref:phosphopantetheine-binding protein n=1 Tax=Pseudomonas brassicacearum TaxID=930166 RepID=UPI0011CED00F
DGSLDSYAQFPSAEAEVADEAAPSSELQTLIGQIWREQLQVEQFQAANHFFLLGGNSIAATQVLARLRETLGLELTLRLLFEAPTLAAFAVAVANQQQDGGQPQGAISALSRDDALP